MRKNDEFSDFERQENSFGGFQYRWNYDEYQRTLQRRRKKSAAHGMRAFFFTSAFIFSLCIISLIAVLLNAVSRSTETEDAAALPDSRQTVPEDDAVPPLKGIGLPAETETKAALQKETAAETTVLTADNPDANAAFSETEVLLQSEEESRRPAADHMILPPVTPDVLSSAGREQAQTMREIASACSASAVSVLCGEGEAASAGSGFFLTKDGYLVTNDHLIRGGEACKVILHDGTVYDADLIGRFAESDVALLKIPYPLAQPVIIGDSRRVEVGDSVIAISIQGGAESAETVENGAVSALNRRVSVTDAGQNVISVVGMMQTTAAVRPGSSGGPLFDETGALIGINTLKQTDDADSMLFSIPIHTVYPMLKEWVQADRLSAGMEKVLPEFPGEKPIFGERTDAVTLGVNVETITKEEADLYRLPIGVLVQFVRPESNGDFGGIKSGDIIIAVNDVAIPSKTIFSAWELGLYNGETARIRVFRDGEELELTIPLHADPLPPDAEQTAPGTEPAETALSAESEVLPPVKSDASEHAEPDIGEQTAARVGWSDAPELSFGAENRDTFGISSVRHLPVYRIASVSDLDAFRTAFAGLLAPDTGSAELPSFDSLTARMDDAYFDAYTVLFTYVASKDSALRYDIREIFTDDTALCVHVETADTQEDSTDDTAGWLLMTPFDKAEIAGITVFDADLDNPAE